MEYLSTEKILIVDLGSGETYEEEIAEELVLERIGGAAITKSLYEQYADEDPIVIGTGLFTGTLYPASALGMITAKSPRTGKLCNVPFTMKVATEMKYAGFDYVVIKGSSDKPVFLWIHDGVADVTDAADVWGKDTWDTVDAWRKMVGDELLQNLVIGPAGENGSDFAQVCTNFWSSGDYFGLGKVFGQKKLKGVALRGMGFLDVDDPEGFIEKALELVGACKKGASAGKKGVEELCAALGAADVPGWLAPLVHTRTSCYNTPFATNTFAYLDEDPGRKEETKVVEPGVLINDAYALMGFKELGLSAEDACRILKCCAKQGVDPYAVAVISKAKGVSSKDQIECNLSGMAGDVALFGNGVFSPWAPNQAVFADSDESWEKRQALAYIFGIHPVYIMMAPELTAQSMVELAQVGTGLDITEETLDSLIAELTEG